MPRSIIQLSSDSDFGLSDSESLWEYSTSNSENADVTRATDMTSTGLTASTVEDTSLDAATEQLVELTITNLTPEEREEINWESAQYDPANSGPPFSHYRYDTSSDEEEEHGSGDDYIVQSNHEQLERVGPPTTESPRGQPIPVIRLVRRPINVKKYEKKIDRKAIERNLLKRTIQKSSPKKQNTPSSKPSSPQPARKWRLVPTVSDRIPPRPNQPMFSSQIPVMTMLHRRWRSDSSSSSDSTSGSSLAGYTPIPRQHRVNKLLRKAATQRAAGLPDTITPLLRARDEAIRRLTRIPCEEPSFGDSNNRNTISTGTQVSGSTPGWGNAASGTSRGWGNAVAGSSPVWGNTVSGSSHGWGNAVPGSPTGWGNAFSGSTAIWGHVVPSSPRVWGNPNLSTPQQLPWNITSGVHQLGSTDSLDSWGSSPRFRPECEPSEEQPPSHDADGYERVLIVIEDAPTPVEPESEPEPEGELLPYADFYDSEEDVDTETEEGSNENEPFFE